MSPPSQAFRSSVISFTLVAFGSAAGAELSQPRYLDWPSGHHDPAGIAVLDLDADGHLDIVVQEQWSLGRFALYRGPAFERPEFFDVGWLTQAIPYGIDLPVADVDGDGHEDLIAILPKGDEDPPTAGAAILAGSRAVIPMPALADGFTAGDRIAAGDIDGDGFADVAVAVEEGGRKSPRVWVYFGPDLASRTRVIEPPTAEETSFGSCLVIADLDGDGAGELLVGSPGRADLSRQPEAWRSRIRIFRGADLPLAGTIESADSPHTPDEGERFVAGDVTGDGHADIVWSIREGLSLYPGPDPVSASSTPWRSGFDVEPSMTLGDVDGDGVANLIVPCFGGSEVLPTPPRTDGAVLPIASWQPDGAPIIVRDLDGDGTPEAIVLDGRPRVLSCPDGPEAPRSLFSFRRGDDVFYAWENRAPYDRILVVSGWEVVAELPGAAERWRTTAGESISLAGQVIGVAGGKSTLRSNYAQPPWVSRYPGGGLTCAVEGGAIRLRWGTSSPPPLEGQIAVLRDDGEIALPPYSAGEYLDANPGEVADRLYIAQIRRSGFYLPVVSMGRTPGTAVGPFVRGQCSEDKPELPYSNVIYALAILFSGEPLPACPRACDANADGRLNIADPVYLLHHEFANGPPPPAPYPECGLDPSPEGLPCDRS